MVQKMFVWSPTRFPVYEVKFHVTSVRSVRGPRLPCPTLSSNYLPTLLLFPKKDSYPQRVSVSPWREKVRSTDQIIPIQDSGLLLSLVPSGSGRTGGRVVTNRTLGG